jgi:CxxC motif-containing protein (DUF1111 family)
MFRNNGNVFRWFSWLVFVLVLPLAIDAGMLLGQTDPGVRGGAPGAGGPIAGYSVKESKFFNAGLDAFLEVQSVQGTIAGTETGLGPRFNLDSCGGCHAQPATGGTSPSVNPQIAVAHKNGATNPRDLSAFIKSDGPVREARFISDGGVHDLFTITGRTDAVGCNISQPDFGAALLAGNLIFRIPTPVFGAGLIESIDDSTILKNAGVSGRANREGNAGTVTRFGWKAQNKSLTIFSGEAYNVEQGVTNDLFTQERDETNGCLFNSTPENHTNYEETQPQKISGDVVNFANFMRFLAPPTPVSSYGSVTASSIASGFTQFNAVGCTLCHMPTMMTGKSPFASLSNKPVNLYSDLLIHDMGDGLKDGISQGLAGPRDFRTAPLWGLGQRIFFLHDGRTNDLLEAVQAHKSAGSEASGSVDAFNILTPALKQDILNFLRSL